MGNEIKTGSDHSFHIIAVNDLEPEWKGKILLRILDGIDTTAQKAEDITIPPYGSRTVEITLTSPVKPGKYVVTASLQKENGKPVSSYREIVFKQ
jgi:hypothetical protein